MAVLIPDKKKLLVILAGPTAVGKTETSIRLANHFNAPIISFDSRQFYQEMTIGTAKPSEQELSQAEHHFINNLSIHQSYTSGKYETDALEKLNKLFQAHDIVIAVGGSGLYINALCYGIDDIPTDETIRQRFIERWKTEGLEKLQEEVKLIDPEFYHSADMKNPRRVIRALEVFQVSGNPYSVYRKNQNKKRFFDTCWIGLNIERQILFDRINKRVDQMIANGLFEEVRQLIPFKELKALKTVGYQEFFEHLEGKHDFAKAVDLVKRNTRIFAKKQLVWFNRNPETTWFSPSETDKIIELLNQKINK